MRAALVGIDGVGKTTVLRRVRERGDVAVVHAVRVHEDPRSSFAALSRSLADASAAADTVGRVQLKLAALYLQLCLYGPAERQAEGGGRLLLADRHPLVDPLVYLPLYAGIERSDEPGGDVETWWRKQGPDIAHAVRDWLRTCSGGADPWSVGAELLRLGTRPPQEMLAGLVRLFDVAMPDAVLLLDLPAAEAVRRTRGRARGSELHETTAALSEARRRYDAVLNWLPEARPEVAVRRIDCRDRSVEEVSEQVWGALEALADARE